MTLKFAELIHIDKKSSVSFNTIQNSSGKGKKGKKCDSRSKDSLVMKYFLILQGLMT